MKNFLKGLYLIISRICLLSSNFIPKKYAMFSTKALMDEICKKSNDRSSEKEIVKSICFSNRKHEPNNYNYCINEIAIVMTGLMYFEHGCNYTLATCEFYRAEYPNVVIIISTWENQVTDDIKIKCREKGILLVVNKEPEISGTGHVNNQIFSSYSGIKEAKKYGAKWVLKTRTDQRLLRNCLLETLIDVNCLYPVNNNGALNRRLIVLGCYNSFRYYPFFLSDFLVFGDINDVKKLYNIPYDVDTRETPENSFDRHQALVSKAHQIECLLSVPDDYYNNIEEGQMLKLASAETYLFSTFAYMYLFNENRNKAPLSDYHKMLREYFIIIDEVMVGLDWPKDKNIGNKVMTDVNRAGNLDSLYWSHLISEKKNGKKTNNYMFK